MSSSKGTILITGGTGKVGSCIAKLCQASSTPYLVASRGASSATASTVHPTVKFDWMDRMTWSNPFITATKSSPIAAVYLVSPPVSDASAIMNDFIDMARKEHGVKRFVLQYVPPQTPNSHKHRWSSHFERGLAAKRHRRGASRPQTNG